MTRNAFISPAYATRVQRILLRAGVCVCAMLPGVALPQSLPDLLRMPVERLLQLEIVPAPALRIERITRTVSREGGRHAP